MEIDDNYIMEAELDTIYNLLLMFELDSPSKYRKYLSDVIGKVRLGIGLKFNIVNLFADNFREDYKNQVVVVPDSRDGARFPVEAFFSELESRKALGKKCLLDLNGDPRFFRGNQE